MQHASCILTYRLIKIFSLHLQQVWMCDILILALKEQRNDDIIMRIIYPVWNTVKKVIVEVHY